MRLTEPKDNLMLAKLRAAKSEESGFTLVELLVVIAILGILAGVVVFSVAGITDNSRAAACKAEASTVKSAEEAYYAKNKVYGDATALTTAPNKLLGSVPTMVDITLSAAVTVAPLAPFGANYSLAFKPGSECTGTP